METVAIVGLGYVGLPVAAGFARRFRTIGYDIDRTRIAELRAGHDRTGEVAPAEFATSRLTFVDTPEPLTAASLYVVTVPTPVTADRRPDFGPLEAACAGIGPTLRRGDIVVFESTVYPGATETICGPALALASGLTCGADFTLGYSPERINPGDSEHRFETITKVVAGQTGAALERIAAAYGAVIEADIHRASSIAVAEAAKVIENTQRDLNIALMNELSQIFERLGLATSDVLAAAETKWNFLPFKPGLVGGHCIGVDPYYLTARAEQVGHHPQVILAGRRLNDGMADYVAGRVVRLLIRAGRPVRDASIAILGLTFKENVPDIRNSLAPRIAVALADFGARPLVHDPLADAAEVERNFGLTLTKLEEIREAEAAIIAVPHDAYRRLGAEQIAQIVRPGGIVADLKGLFAPARIEPARHYWSL